MISPEKSCCCATLTCTCHNNCDECRAFHKSRGTRTSCEKMEKKLKANSVDSRQLFGEYAGPALSPAAGENNSIID